MMNSNLQHTVFSVEKIRNVVNVGRCSAYQIYTSPGEEIGYLGLVSTHGAENAANDARPTRETTRIITLRRRFS